MEKVRLDPDEGMILRDSSILHERGGFFDSQGDELMLTNKALVVVHKGVFGQVKESIRFPLRQIKVINGIPQVFQGKSETGNCALQVHCVHGIETFVLGKSDEEESEISLKAIFSLSGEKRNTETWRQAISDAVLAVYRGENPIVEAPSPVPYSETPVPGATRKCIGCRAPISGSKGQKVRCLYCDIEQVIE